MSHFWKRLDEATDSPRRLRQLLTGAGSLA
jgi:hypothetical protein